MKKIILFALAIMALMLVFGCQPKQPVNTDNDLFNNSLNDELEVLSDLSNVSKPGFVEFYFNYTPRAEAKYEYARDDVYTLSQGNLTSAEVSVLGVMLGDSYDEVLERLPIPDVMYIAADKSYRNMEYSKKIGIGGITTAITYHLDNDVVTRISMRLPFDKYLHGNTSMEQSKEYLYATFSVPEYQDFIANHKVFHYVEKGFDFYLNRAETQIVSLMLPREFKGVEYRTVLEDLGDGIIVNSTKAYLK
jgi:hypothetical protein